MMVLDKTGALKTLVLTTLPISLGVEASDLDLALGVTGFVQQSFVVGADEKAELLPYLDLRYGMFVAGPDGVGLTTALGDRDQLSVLLGVRETLVESDNQQLAHLTERKDAGELALHWTHLTPYFDVTTALAMDVSETHEGYEAKLMLSKTMPTDFGVFIPAAAIHYQSDELVDYYYGVSPSEANMAYSAYDGKGSVNTNVSFTHVYPLTDQWHVATMVAYDHLGEGVQDSTIVEHSSYWSGAVSVYYAF